MHKAAVYQEQVRDYLDYFSAQVSQGKYSPLSRLEILAIQTFAEWLDGQKQESATQPPSPQPVENPKGNWTRKEPTQPGWYWVTDKYHDEPFIVHLFYMGVGDRFLTALTDDEMYHGGDSTLWWSESIPTPRQEV